MVLSMYLHNDYDFQMTTFLFVLSSWMLHCGFDNIPDKLVSEVKMSPKIKSISSHYYYLLY